MPIDTEVKSKVLVNPAYEVETVDAVLLSGQNLKQGDIVDIITTGGNVGKIQGTDKAPRTNLDYFGVLGEDCNATGADRGTFVIVAGSLNENYVALPAGANRVITWDVKLALRKVGIRINKFLES
jgi:hypothetical protein